MSKYKIIESIYYNEKGKADPPNYFIKELKPIIPFFGWKRWVYIRETVNGWDRSYQRKMVWSSVEDAQKFINEVLCPQIPRSDYKIKEIKTVNCNN